MVTYCTADDVRRILQTDFKFSSESLPSNSDVEASIEEAEDEIDQETQHSWRTTTVTDDFYDIPLDAWREGVGIPIFLKHRNVKDLDSDQGDSLEIWDGSSYEDWLSTMTEGRNNDYWVDNTMGILYLRRFWRFYRERAVKISYRYGESSVPKDIRKACAILTAIDFIMNDDRSAALNETGDPMRVSHTERVEFMKKRVDRILKNRREIFLA
jgi:hypothetical protein